MPRSTRLNVMAIKKPCDADWDAMTGDDKRRFCDHCGKFVHNLAAMPIDEAERLVCDHAGSLCVRMAATIPPTGPRPLTYAAAPIPTRRRAVATITSILAAITFAGGWTAFKLFAKATVATPPAGPMMVLGEMVCPAPPPAPTVTPGEVPLPGVPL